MSYSPRLIYILSFLLAFCSLTYELVFAQILSICLGGTKYQYLLTIAIFTFSLGIGTISFGPIKKRISIQSIFVSVELLLTILGALGPFFITWLLRINDQAPFFENITIFMSYFIIFIVGFLSGFELPCLFSLSEDNHGKVLAFDYVGMLSGSLFFPLVGLPILGTAGTALVISIINLITIVYIRPFETKMVGHSFVLLNIIFLGLIFYSREFLNDILTSIYLIGV